MRHRLLIRHGVYRDSITLLTISREVAALAGVETALVAMGTPVNLVLAADLGFEVPGAGPNDLLIALRADGEDSLAEAEDVIDRRLAAHATPDPAGRADQADPRTIRAAAVVARRESRPASVALISVPGAHAVPEAMDALEAGLHVMLFSDNVPLAHERALKLEARRRGLLVMGPDCGTAMLGGVGLGFANVVQAGVVGVVTASGTGAQQLSCLLDAAGVGLSHIVGVGGRDLSADVGGISTLQALEALEQDPDTDVIVVLSKPAPSSVARVLRDAIRRCTTPVVTALIGPGQPTIEQTSGAVLAALGRPPHAPVAWPCAQPSGRRLIGLFSGGTSCVEAMAIATERIGPIRSNLAADAALHVEPADVGVQGADHRLIDYGVDTLTVGRAHPMIDFTVRLQHLRSHVRTGIPTVALIDVVLGHGAHAAPGPELANAIIDARQQALAHGGSLAAVVSLIGTNGDPQHRDRTASILVEAGVSVYTSNAAATTAATDLVGGPHGR